MLNITTSYFMLKLGILPPSSVICNFGDGSYLFTFSKLLISIVESRLIFLGNAGLLGVFFSNSLLRLPLSPKYKLIVRELDCLIFLILFFNLDPPGVTLRVFFPMCVYFLSLTGIGTSVTSLSTWSSARRSGLITYWLATILELLKIA